MKKSELLMIALIIFLVICSIVRLGVAFPLWESIVSAITFSSYFFALADYCKMMANEKREEIQISKGIVSESVHFIAMIRNSIQHTEDALNDKKRCQHFQETKRLLKEVETNCEKEKVLVNKEISTVKALSITADLWVGFAFLLFLLILAFHDFFSKFPPFKYPDVTTVLAFAVILSTQYMKNVYVERNKRELETKKLLKDSWEVLYESYQIEEKEVAASQLESLSQE